MGRGDPNFHGRGKLGREKGPGGGVGLLGNGQKTGKLQPPECSGKKGLGLGRRFKSIFSGAGGGGAKGATG